MVDYSPQDYSQQSDQTHGSQASDGIVRVGVDPILGQDRLADERPLVAFGIERVFEFVEKLVDVEFEAHGLLDLFAAAVIRFAEAIEVIEVIDDRVILADPDADGRPILGHTPTMQASRKKVRQTGGTP